MSRLVLLLCCLISLPAYAQIIEIAGSTTVKAFIEPAAAAFLKLHPEVIIHISGGGSGVGAAAVMDGRATLGMMSRELTAGEQSRMQGIEQVRIGYDAVVVAVSDMIYHQGSLHALSKTDIAAIYRGKIHNWQDLGGPDRAILLIDREKKSGTRHAFAGYILDNAYADSSKNAVIVGPNRDMEMLLQASDQAIGFLPFGETGEQVHGLALRVNGQLLTPDESSVRDASYPLSRSLYLLYRKQHAPDYLIQFIDFLGSEAGQAILRRVGYIAVK